MTRIRLRYYIVKKCRSGRAYGYWQPSKKMRDAGFVLVPCGADGPEAWQKAEHWNSRWDEYRGKGGELPHWPYGSIGAAYDEFRSTGIWAAKKERTREDWERGWKYISPIFGDVAADAIALAQLDVWYRSIVHGQGIREGWRALKIWRALWQVMTALGYVKKADPSKAIRRQTPAARQALWSEGEVVRLAKAAWRRGYRGLACVIATCFDAALSPVDARLLTFAQMAQNGQKLSFRIDRAKSGRAALGTLSRRSGALVLAYIASLPGEHFPAAPIFRNRLGRPYSKSALAHDFAKVRGAGETRTIADMRRSAMVEAMLGGASAEQMAAKAANTLDANSALWQTYVPVDKRAVEAVDAARIKGRRK